MISPLDLLEVVIDFLLVPSLVIGTLLGIGAALLFSYFFSHEGPPIFEACLVLAGFCGGLLYSGGVKKSE